MRRVLFASVPALTVAMLPFGRGTETTLLDIS